MKKLTHSLFIAGVITVVIATASVTAQTNSVPATNLFPALQGIELTTEQQGKVAKLADDTLSGVSSILTPQQYEQLKTSMQQGKTLKDVMPTLNLSLGQKMKLKGEINAAQTEMSQILTPEQEKQRQQNLQAIQQKS